MLDARVAQVCGPFTLNNFNNAYRELFVRII
jgi:hypothetical protein